MTIYFSLDHNLVNKINFNLNRYSNSSIEIVVGKFKGIFTKNIGDDTLTKIRTHLSALPDFTEQVIHNTISTQSFDGFDVDLTQYNIRFQVIKNTYNVDGGITYEYSNKSRNILFRLVCNESGRYCSLIYNRSPSELSGLIPYLKILFEPIVKGKFMISYAERRQVTDCYNFLVKKQNKNPVIVFNKPYNLTRECLPDILKTDNNFLLFPKLDGIRYLAYLVDSSCYMINYTDFLKISDDEDSNYDNTLLDGELIGDTYYPFDVIFWKGDDIRKKTRVERLSYLESITLNFKTTVIAPEVSIARGLKKYLNNPSIPTDGVVLTLNSSNYNNSKTYKYKICENQMIDFEIGKNKELLVKNYDGKSCPFTGTPEIPYSPTPVKDDLGIMDKGGIVEFKWSDGRFETVRERCDKIYPNFIEVAKVIWGEINDPIKLLVQNNSSILQPDEMEAIDSPLTNDMMRTGTITDGSCMFHSIFYSNDKYRSMSTPRRKKFVEEMRDIFSKNIKLDEWLQLGGGEISRVSYEYLFLEFFKKIYITTLYESQKLKNNIYYMLFSKYKLAYFTDTVIPSIFKNGHEKIDFFTNDKYTEAFQVLIPEINKLATDTAFKKFVSKIKSPSEWVDQSMLEFVSKVFDKDVYIIDIANGLPYPIPGYDKILKNRKSVIVGYIRDSHFESIGIRDKSGDIQREFDGSDPLITLIKRFYC